MKSRHRHIQWLFACVVLFASHAANAADAVERRIAALEARVTALEKQLAGGGQGTQIPPAFAQPRASSAGGAWKKPETWKKLRKGMNEKQVRAILGEPDSYSEANGGFRHLSYQDGSLLAVVMFVNGGLEIWQTPAFPAQ